MTILRLSKELSGAVATKSQQFTNTPQKLIDDFVQKDDNFQSIARHCKQILNDRLHVVIQNVGFNRQKKLFEAFVKLFGKFYGTVEYTAINIESPYVGGQHKEIILHNDDAIDLFQQPNNTFIQVINEDPLKSTKNGVVDIDDIVNHLMIYDTELLDKLFDHEVPMLSYGINFDGDNKEEIITTEPILYKSNEENHVRFDLTRILHYYWKKQLTQSTDEKHLIDSFLTIAKKYRREYYLAAGDMLILCNKRTLHDRSECNFRLNIDGSFETREIFVSFTRE